MKKFNLLKSLLLSILLITLSSCYNSSNGDDKYFRSDIPQNSSKPWTEKALTANSDNFSMAVISDRTGGHLTGRFESAVNIINSQNPNLIINVGDLIEGYTSDINELDAEWKEIDNLSEKFKVRFFKTPGNHDISNETALKYWKNNFGRDYYYFIFNDVLFLCLNTQDPPKNFEYETNKQKESESKTVANSSANTFHDSNKEQNKLKVNYEIVHGRALISDSQSNYFKKVINDNKNVKWTFVFLHIPAWKLGYKCENFNNIVSNLENGKYTVFAGHEHIYQEYSFNGCKHFVLFPTAAIPRDTIPEAQNQIMFVDFNGSEPTFRFMKNE